MRTWDEQRHDEIVSSFAAKGFVTDTCGLNYDDPVSQSVSHIVDGTNSIRYMDRGIWLVVAYQALEGVLRLSHLG